MAVLRKISGWGMLVLFAVGMAYLPITIYYIISFIKGAS